MSGAEQNPLVIDTGSEILKAGFAGDEGPRAVFPSIVGRRCVRAYYSPPTGRYSWKFYQPPKDIYVGDQALCKRAECKLKYPIEHGVVIDFNDMEELLHHTLCNELRATPEEHPVLLTETALNPKANREKITRIMFERFNVPNFYLACQSVLALYSCGKTTGIVVESGSITRTVPVYEQYVLPEAVNTLNIGGRDIAEYLIKLLKQKEYSFTFSESSFNIKEEITNYKEKLAYIAENYNTGLKEKGWLCRNYELPDGKIITGGDQLLKCSEIIFNPKCIDIDNDGVSIMLIKSIMSCDIDIRKDMMENIILSGGNTMIDGFDKRLQMDIGSILFKPLVNGFVRKYSMNRIYDDYLNLMYAYYGISDSNISNKYNSYVVGCNEFNIVGCNEFNTPRKYYVWLGGSICTSLSTFEEMWITKSEYDESGPAIVHRKCT